MASELITAAQAAEERGTSESRMRDLIAVHGVVAVAREPGRAGRNLYPADALRAIPPPHQGSRYDLVARRIGQMFAAARVVAAARGGLDELNKIHATCLDGNPAAVRMLHTAVRRWIKRRPVPVDVAEAARLVEQLAGQIGELPKVLPMPVRMRIITAEAAARQNKEEESHD